MAIPNYKDLLDLIGLSSWQFIAIVVVVVALWPFAVLLWKTGVVKKVSVQSVTMPHFKCVYISYSGSYDDLGKIYSQAVEDFKMVFKMSNYFIILYDRPESQTQSSLSKAVIGLAAHLLQRGKIPLFLSKFPQYKTGEFLTSDCLKSTLPYFSISPILAIGRVYPAIDKKLKELSITVKHSQIMQIYHENDPQPSISILVPITNEQSFQLWYEPTDYSRIEPKKRQ